MNISIHAFSLVVTVYMFVGCAAADPKVEAAAGFAAQQLACVDNNADKPAIDACRAKVRAEWAVDAGGDR